MLDKSLLKDASSMKIASWVYIADKIESDLVASIEHLRSKMDSGECEEILKPVYVAQFGKIVFHGQGLKFALHLAHQFQAGSWIM
ncbi:hypothetical protein GIB67_025842 [Kingdonia uniflora]|uniref:DUF7903 domain-containing protein n=1 Tax=Kingdonia uniflora TaxID=39325 RepID=A0A7J7PBY3_9MAGN|nr:hypothetical protein GIB67_025842 [Kingdonia uniflora]